MNKDLLFRTLMILALSTASPGLTSNAHADALQQYREQALTARFSWWGWNHVNLTRNGQDVELGFFGGGADEIFANSPEALRSIETFRQLRIAGTVLWAAGLAGLTAEIILLVARSSLVVEDGPFGKSFKTGPFLGLLIPSAAIGLGGGILMQVATSYVYTATDQYNADLQRRLHVPTSGLGRPIGLSYSRSF